MILRLIGFGDAISSSTSLYATGIVKRFDMNARHNATRRGADFYSLLPGVKTNSQLLQSIINISITEEMQSRNRHIRSICMLPY